MTFETVKVFPKAIIITISVFGVILPFIPSLVVIEFFYLLIPLIIALVASVLFLLLCVFIKTIQTKKSIFIFSIIPLFIISQFVSVLMVDKIQRLRSDHVIKKIEQVRKDSGEFPDQDVIGPGIKYKKLDNGKRFRISYSRGFMVTEIYYSDIYIWKSYGWND